jgi:inorganic pyrophosphatase
MDLSKAPHTVPVMIEIPACHSPIKYEMDKASGHLIVDRFLSTPMHYPANYGYVPNTLCDDGDPLDALVITPYPLHPAVIIDARPIAVLMMEDEKGQDEKLLCVAAPHLTTEYNHIKSYQDVPATILKQITYFFEHYKDHEPNKWVKLGGFQDLDKTHQVIQQAIKLHQADQ